ncbi:helix-turn-helix transcriptional regulator [Alkalicoccus luteus]|uniref:Helix-turn-helix transcriptional regulator n=1 Tax=Alkalicoccus luteus TaxID=1237094 RepID=A0A969PRJ4_9BACI|nr:helix-turn-helix transcriptional regulator [Alkalicoccus luteus]NJP37709.1 helix-turn-helix transcriptional regulator [Alkalicoccus luteus]
MELSARQQKIVEIVKEKGPITGEKIADMLALTRATLRPDLTVLTMSGYLDARPRVGYYYTGKTGGQLFKDKLLKLKVKDFQSIPVVITEAASVYDAIVSMFLEDVGTLFVTDNQNKLVGIVSRKDLLRASMGKQDLEGIPVSIIMTRMPNVTVCYPEETMLETANKLISKQIDGLPVVKQDADGKLDVIGRLTKTNITKAFVELSREDG